MSQQSPLSSLSPMRLFIGGIVTGVLVLCTIGFFIMIGLYVGNDSDTRVAGDRVVNTGAAAQPTAAQPSAPTEITLADVSSDEHIRGNKNADITIVEFSDLECPYCQQFHNTMKQVVDTYGDDVRWVYRHFPLTSIHPDATKLALATECAAEQGKFWELADMIFENPRAGAADTTLEGYAKEIGLNVSSFSSCVSSQKYAKDVSDDASDAQGAGGRGTPYSVVIGPDGQTSALSGAQPYAAVEAAILQYLD